MNVEICVYGAEVLCASCVNMPSAKDTASWLKAALERKFIDQPFTIRYIDVYNMDESNGVDEFAEKIRQDELFYPLVVIKNQIIGEGDIRLNKVVSALEEIGYQVKSE